MVVLKLNVDYIDRGGNFAQREFTRVRHGGLIFGSSILEFLTEFL